MVSSPLNATIVLSLFNSATAVGQVLVGHLTDRYPYPWIMFFSTFGSAIAAFLLWGFADTLVRVFVFAVIFGCLVRIHALRYILPINIRTFNVRWEAFHPYGQPCRAIVPGDIQIM